MYCSKIYRKCPYSIQNPSDTIFFSSSSFVRVRSDTWPFQLAQFQDPLSRSRREVGVVGQRVERYIGTCVRCVRYVNICVYRRFSSCKEMVPQEKIVCAPSVLSSRARGGGYMYHLYKPVSLCSVDSSSLRMRQNWAQVGMACIDFMTF